MFIPINIRKHFVSKTILDVKQLRLLSAIASDFSLEFPRVETNELKTDYVFQNVTGLYVKTAIDNKIINYANV